MTEKINTEELEKKQKLELAIARCGNAVVDTNFKLGVTCPEEKWKIKANVNVEDLALLVEAAKPAVEDANKEESKKSKVYVGETLDGKKVYLKTDSLRSYQVTAMEEAVRQSRWPVQRQEIISDEAHHLKVTPEQQARAKDKAKIAELENELSKTKAERDEAKKQILDYSTELTQTKRNHEAELKNNGRLKEFYVRVASLVFGQTIIFEDEAILRAIKKLKDSGASHAAAYKSLEDFSKKNTDALRSAFTPPPYTWTEAHTAMLKRTATSQHRVSVVVQEPGKNRRRSYISSVNLQRGYAKSVLIHGKKYQLSWCDPSTLKITERLKKS